MSRTTPALVAVALAWALAAPASALAQQGGGEPAQGNQQHKPASQQGGAGRTPGQQGGSHAATGSQTRGHVGGSPQGLKNTDVSAHGPGHPVSHGQLPMHNFAGRPFHGQLAWERGHWRHERHNGRLGWWWDVGGVWYFYPERVDGPPAYVSEVEVVDDSYADPDGPVVEEVAPPGPVRVLPPPPPGLVRAPPPPPPPPDAVGGAVGGAILGGILGGVVSGRPGGAIAGALIGGTTGAMIGAEAERRRGYYWWHGGCYYRYPSGEYAAVAVNYCN